jgi:hypothetical protein
MTLTVVRSRSSIIVRGYLVHHIVISPIGGSLRIVIASARG